MIHSLRTTELLELVFFFFIFGSSKMYSYVFKLRAEILSTEYTFKGEYQKGPKSVGIGSSDRADFHIYCLAFHADHHGAIRFS